MANDKVALWGSSLKFGRSPGDGELLIGNGLGFDMATITAGSGVSISNKSGAITISATGSGGTVTSVTASSPLASSGGNTPNITLGTVPVGNGGTGATSLTANNVILGNGTSAVQFVAPGPSGNVLTSDGTTWQSSPAPQNWTLIKKTSDQSRTSSTALTDDNQFFFSASSGKTFLFRGLYIVTVAGGGADFVVNGPAASRVRMFSNATGSNIGVNSYNASGWAFTGTASVILFYRFYGAITTTASGTIVLRIRQNTSSANATVFESGSWMEWSEF